MAGIPNIESAPAWDAQAIADASDWQNITDGFSVTGLISGCVVSAHGTPSMNVAVSAGSVACSGVVVSVAAASVAIPAASTSDRRDIIIALSSGAASVVTGTPCGTAGWTRSTYPGLPPVKAAIPANCVFLGEVYVAATTTSITSANILLSGTQLLVASNYVTSFNNRTYAVTLQASDVDGTFSAAGQIPVGTGSGTGEYLASGSVGTILTSLGLNTTPQWLTQVVNVKAYGAGGLGATDDTAAIKAAMAAASVTETTGSEIFFPAGTYNFSSQLFVPPGVSFRGANMAATTLKWTGGSVGSGANDYSQAAITFLNSAANSYLIFARDFSVVGPGSANQNIAASVSTANGVSGIEIQGKGLFTSVNCSRFDNGFVTNMAQGHFAMLNCVANVNYAGVRWYQFSGDHLYADCDFTLNNFTGFYIDASCNIIESLTCLRTHTGFAPFGVYQDAGNALRMFRDCNFNMLKFEKIGNAAVYYAASQPTSSHSGGWGGVTMQNPVYQFSSTYTNASLYSGGGIVIGALEDDNKIFGHGTFESISITMPIQYQGQGRLTLDAGSGLSSDQTTLNPTITNNATNPAPRSSWLYLPGQSPRGIFRPARQGYVGWTLDPAVASSGSAMSSGVIYLMLVAPDTLQAINYASVILNTQGTGTGGWENGCLTAVYDTGQTLSTSASVTLLQSASVASQLVASGSGAEIAGSLAASVQAYPDGDLLVACLVNYNWGTTTPTFSRGSAVGNLQSNVNTQLFPRFSSYGTGLTTLPSVIATSSLTKIAPAFWAGIR